MQRQKTVAKWLAVIVLLTVAVGSYILYDSFYTDLGDDHTATGGDNTGESNPPEDNTPQIPEYTTLPRPAESYRGLTVSHAGGEGADSAQTAVFFADKTAVFFSSDSLGYDCRGAGMYVAVFTDNEVTSVSRISDSEEEEVPVTSTLSSEGVLLLSRTPTGGGLHLFDVSARETASADIDAFGHAAFCSDGSSTHLFYTDSRGLNAAVVGSGLTLEKSAYYLAGGVEEIYQAFYTGTVFVIVARTAAEGVTIITFEQNKGFNIRYGLKNHTFMQFSPLAGEEGIMFVLLTATAGGLALNTFANDGEYVASATIDNASYGAVLSDGTSLRVLAAGKIYTYCRHLDLVAATSFAPSFDEVYFAVRAESGHIVGVREGNDFSVYALADSAASPLLMISGEGLPDGKCLTALSGDKLRLVFSSSSDKDFYYGAFGKGDVFSLTLSAAESGVC